jgi:hypothetical protein
LAICFEVLKRILGTKEQAATFSHTCLHYQKKRNLTLN